jgi:hypothetical protein
MGVLIGLDSTWTDIVSRKNAAMKIALGDADAQRRHATDTRVTAFGNTVLHEAERSFIHRRSVGPPKRHDHRCVNS